ncbi:unnamed protein product [Pipistrellus nathusii]|uniref:Uncharacterized protein n=1 Tax=Pipistrellus nathusii TaxID=59473 RepID=A0ABP0ALV6_PIPNA
MPRGRDAWVLRAGGAWAHGAAGLAASAPFHWLRRSSVSAARPNARTQGAGAGADAAVSRCCRDAAAGAAALTRGASSSERHRGGPGGDAVGSEWLEAADAAGPGCVTRQRRGGSGVLIPTLQFLEPPDQVRGAEGGAAAAEMGGGREPIGGGERSEGRGRLGG